jgi:glycosyltransferase involved in cell wall biosynthesis
MKKILFISHGNSLSGAPLVLLYFMQWLKHNHKNYQIDLLVLNEGTLSPDFRNVTDNYYSISSLERKFLFQKQLPFSLKKRVDYFLKKRFFKGLRNNSYDIIYANTVATLQIASKLKDSSKCELVLHVHELNTVINQIAPNFKDLKNTVDKFIAVSGLVKDNLITKYAIESEKIKMIYEFSKVEKVVINQKKGEDDFLVCGCGYVDWRKGTDLFIQVARHLVFNKRNRKIKFIWIGKISLEERIIIEADIEKMGLTDYVSFVGEQLTPHTILKDCDVFLLPSREDPFPLVCIETAMLGKPIICFDKATGITEILKNGGGYIIPYLEVEKMADKVEHYMNNPEEIYHDGLVNQKNFLNFTPDKVCPEIFDFLSKKIV